MEFNYSDYCIIIFIVLVGSIETNILSGVRPIPMLLIWWRSRDHNHPDDHPDDHTNDPSDNRIEQNLI